MFTTYDFVVHFLSPPQQSLLKFLDIIITYSSQTRHPLPLLPRLKSFWPKVCNKFTYNIHPCTSLQIRHSSSFVLSVPRWHAGLQQFFASHSGGQPLDRPLTNSSILAPYFFPLQPLKVHLITIFFFFSLKNSLCFGDLFEKIFWFCQILNFLWPVENGKSYWNCCHFCSRPCFCGSRVWWLLWHHFKNTTICISHHFRQFTCLCLKV